MIRIGNKADKSLGIQPLQNAGNRRMLQTEAFADVAGIDGLLLTGKPCKHIGLRWCQLPFDNVVCALPLHRIADALDADADGLVHEFHVSPQEYVARYIFRLPINALAEKPLPVYGEGINVRDWLYVEDHCKAIDLIIRNGKVGEVYNIGGHNEMKNIDIVKIICKALGKSEDLIVHVTDRKGHDMRYAIDPAKIHAELGWLPETKFVDGIQKTIKWYLDNKEWWERIVSGEYQKYYDEMYGNRLKTKR